MKIAAVVVTHNRLNLLKECIESLENQKRKIDDIYVVNNSSTDGTTEWLTTKNNLTILNEKNLGASNGFFLGIKKAYDEGADWIWCLDDDTVVEEQSLSAMLNSDKIEQTDTGFICSVVNWTNGNLHKMNVVMPLTNKFNIYKNIIDDLSVEVEAASFVSLLLSRNAIKKCGLPIKEFFIWLDDYEYTTRISRAFKCYLKIDSTVVHKTLYNEATGYELMNKKNFFKFKHLIRNRIWVLRKSTKEKNVLKIIYTHLNHIIMVLNFSLKQGLLIESMKSVYDGYFFNPVVIDKYE
jgi:hypothetical protein